MFGRSADTVVLASSATPEQSVRDYFLSRLDGVPAIRTDTLWTATSVANWLSDQVSQMESSDSSAGPNKQGASDVSSLALFEQTMSGSRYNCLTLATIYYDAVRSTGVRARRVDLATRPHSPYESHSVVEIWSTTHGKWILIDPFFSAYYTVDGVPASALELHDLVVRESVSSIGMSRIAAANRVDPRKYRINPLLYFRHVKYATTDGRWLLYSASSATVTPVADPMVLQTDKADPFALPTDQQVHLARVEVGTTGQIVRQRLHDRVYVCIPAELWKDGALEYRITEGSEVGTSPDVLPYLPTDEFLCRTESLIENSTLLDADSNGSPDGWTVSASANDTYTIGPNGLTIQAGELGCQLTVPIRIRDFGTFIAFCRADVLAGSLRMSFPTRRAFATVEMMPGIGRTISTPILRSRGTEDLLIELAPGTQCTIHSVEARPARTIAEFGF